MKCGFRKAGWIPGKRSFKKYGVKEYADSAIVYILQVWAATEDYWTTYYTINEAISREFAQDHIEMTYPHLNVHLDGTAFPQNRNP